MDISDGTGKFTRFANFRSHFVAPRHVDVWCPPSYKSEPTYRFPVVYLHDGQNMLDPVFAFGGVDWGVDEAILRLVSEGYLPGMIVVAIWNTPLRYREYMPEKPLHTPQGTGLLERVEKKANGPILSDLYLNFLVKELKPTIDAKFRTLPDAAHTFVMGSSMGALISLYALAEYPETFGGAGCLSPHWPFANGVLVEYFGKALPRAGKHRLYFDFGTEGLDSEYALYQQKMDEHLYRLGYRYERDWLSLKFEGAEHSERAWRERVHIPLKMFLKE